LNDLSKQTVVPIVRIA